MKALLNLFVESAANDQATYSEWNNISYVNRTSTSEQSWRREEPMPRRKQSMQVKQLTARNKNALARVTLQENKITPNRTPWMTRNILSLHRKLHRLYKRWRRSHNHEDKQLYKKIRNLVQRKSKLPKIALPITSPNGWTRSIKTTLTFGEKWINTNNLLHIGPSLFYVIALPFSRTMVKAIIFCVRIYSAECQLIASPFAPKTRIYRIVRCLSCSYASWFIQIQRSPWSNDCEKLFSITEIVSSEVFGTHFHQTNSCAVLQCLVWKLFNSNNLLVFCPVNCFLRGGLIFTPWVAMWSIK